VAEEHTFLGHFGNVARTLVPHHEMARADIPARPCTVVASSGTIWRGKSVTMS
jgi:hypothetical protein